MIVPDPPSRLISNTSSIGPCSVQLNSRLSMNNNIKDLALTFMRASAAHHRKEGDDENHCIASLVLFRFLCSFDNLANYNGWYDFLVTKWLTTMRSKFLHCIRLMCHMQIIYVIAHARIQFLVLFFCMSCNKSHSHSHFAQYARANDLFLAFLHRIVRY